MRQALDTAEQLLRRHGHVYEANQVAIAGELFALDPAAACRAMNDAGWWDDRQSVASVDLALSGGFTPEARSDARSLRAALIEIYTAMRAYGEHNTSAEIIVSQFRKWRESHV